MIQGSSAETFFRMRQPDEACDVICHQRRRADGRDTWDIRLGPNTQAERETLSEAIDLARELALMYSRPAWLLDETGYPLKPMLPWSM